MGLLYIDAKKSKYIAFLQTICDNFEGFIKK